MDLKKIQNIKQRYDIIGNCEALAHAIDIALKIASVDLSVMVTGENGVGKEVFPRIIHDNSRRKNKKYFAVNCGAIPEGTIDSELFGHEKGSFTGAVEKREGYFSVANGGTLFLDEVGELPLSTQARLLRVLETGEYISVGSSEIKKTDVRIVAATNVNMEKAIADRKFREDLYYRLNSISIIVPPLRERGGDILLLFKKFVLDMAEKYKMPPIRLNEESANLLLSYSWPGNIRQLKNLAESMSVTVDAREITPDIMKKYIPEEKQSHSQLLVPQNSRAQRTFENEREILYQVLYDLKRDMTELKKIVHEQLMQKSSQKEASKDSFSLSLLNRGEEKQTRTKYETILSEAEEVKDADENRNASHSLEEQEIELIQKVLDETGGRRKAAAEQLGISERTLYRKIKEYGLEK